MSIITRQILWGMLYSLSLALMLSTFFILFYPPTNLEIIWEQEIFDLPFIISIPVVSVFVGIIAGALSGYSWHKQIKQISDSFIEVEQGKTIPKAAKKQVAEVESVLKKMNKLQQHVAEQVVLSQKLANERAEDQEKRVQEIVSQERNRLARELHDSVSQQLFGASMLMSAINETRSLDNETENRQLQMVEQMIHQSQLEMRALLLHLRPVPLKGKTLQEGIKELLMELKQKVPIDITWKIEDTALDKGVEDHLFRILQESVSNTLRHSKASSLEVLLICREQMIIMRVTDDGKGFEVEQSRTGSYGLQNMHERAVEIGGTLKIVSVVQKGTRLEVKVPVLKKDGSDD
ncbi:sensor histidine kinase [Peribacillus alkalitolerans]|uniref:sensor histidine kinase n=1 Tax=Peribacillus alkalitolerans TaxID=1550385 RepID=UPI0013D4EF7C|nr:sensor histidine kinase [Peribacillus alkalitolerans]